MIRFENVCKRYKTKTIIKDLNLEMDKGKLIVIIGESGCGKTTLLKMINRLIEATSGKIYINGQDIKKTDATELRRKIGYVIQQTGLFQHMTVKENIQIIPKTQKIGKEIIEEETLRVMKMVGLEPKEFLERYPRELSGGQQQRVGVARAFITNPDIILMDEPFSALDPITKSDLQDELVELQSKINKTIVFVTHDMAEAIKIADKICIMKNGEILQYDTPENILKNPVDDFVSNFVGKNRIWSSPEFIKLGDIMLDKPITASRELPILKCIDKMRQNKVDSLLIVDSETRQLQGVVKAKHLRNIDDKSQKINSLMKTDFIKLSPKDNILDALKIVNEYHTSIIPIVDDKNILKGLVTKSSLVTTLSQQYIEVEVD